MNNSIVRWTILLSTVFLISSAPAQSGGPYQLTWSTIDGGGGQSAGGDYVLTGTIGQPDAANSSGGQYEVLGGFLPGGPLCIVEFEDYARLAVNWLDVGPELPGDLNGDGDVDGVDLRRFVDEWLWECPYRWPLK